MGQQSESMRAVWLKILHREPTPQERSRYHRLGTTMLMDTANTIALEEENKETEAALIYLAQKTEKKFGVSLVSTYGIQCGIATYCENLFFALKDLGVRCNVLSDEGRIRVELPSEDGVIKCWNVNNDNFPNRIVKTAIKASNNIVHIQLEWGLMPNTNHFRDMVLLLKKCGFKVVVTLHTVFEDRNHDWVYKEADVLIVHCETAAARLNGHGISALTVIPHGSEKRLKFTRQNSRKFVSKFIDLGENDILASSIGFISVNKLQKETLLAVIEAQKHEPRLKYLLIGSTGRRSYDFDYLPRLQELVTDRAKVIQKFLTDDEMARILTASDFGIYGYEQTNYSISGASHLAMTYGLPTISSTARILSDLTPGMSIKVNMGDQQTMIGAILEMCRNEDLRDQMGKAAAAEAERTSWDKVATMHLSVYKTIAEEG